MRAVLLGLVTAIMLLGSVMADPSNLEGGVFIAHHPAAMEFSSDPPPGGWCQHYLDDYAITSCEEQVNRIDSLGAAMWLVIAAWDSAKTWCGVEFGLGTYADSIFSFVDYGPCFPLDGLELSTNGWPGSNQGTAFVSVQEHWSGNYVPVYYFLGYTYGEGTIPIAVDPATGFVGTCNCATPPLRWVVADAGGMGLLEDGIYVCPEAPQSGIGGLNAGWEWVGACCVNHGCQIMLEDDCRDLDGEWQAGITDCDPNPCEIAVNPEIRIRVKLASDR